MVEDADGDGSLYGVDEPVLTAAERERERERETAGRVDGTANLRPLVVEPQTECRSNKIPTSRTCPEWTAQWWQWWMNLTAEENLDFWISNC